jgi:hypothetical protein
MGEMAGYISLSQHFRQIKEMGKTTVSSSWETDSGLGDSPPSTPGYHAHCMPFRLEEEEGEQGQQKQEQEEGEQQQKQQKEQEQEPQNEQQQEQEEQEKQEQQQEEGEQEEEQKEVDEQNDDLQTDWKNLLVFPGKALILSYL